MFVAGVAYLFGPINVPGTRCGTKIDGVQQEFVTRMASSTAEVDGGTDASFSFLLLRPGSPANDGFGRSMAPLQTVAGGPNGPRGPPRPRTQLTHPCDWAGGREAKSQAKLERASDGVGKLERSWANDRWRQLFHIVSLELHAAI